MNFIQSLFIILLSVNCYFVCGQQEELVVHRSHSSDIQLLEFGKSGTLLASLGENSEIIIWNTKLGRLLTSFYIDEYEEIKSMSFNETETALFVKTKNTVFKFDISLSTIENVGNIKLRRNRLKNYYADEEKNTELIIKKGTIQKRPKGKKIPIFRCSGNSLDSKLNAFDVSPDKKNIIAAGDDGKLYSYTYGFGVGSFRYFGHNAAVNDVVYTEDGKFFASGGKDRSIIIWNAETYEIERRISSSIYRKNTVEHSADGSLIYVGDELGYVYSININGNFPEVAAKKVSSQSLNNITYSKTAKNYYLSTSDNRLLEKQQPLDDKNVKTYSFTQYPVKHTKAILLSALNSYQKPFGKVNDVCMTEKGEKIAFTGAGDNPNITVYNSSKNEVTKLYKKNNSADFGNVFFLHEKLLISHSRNKADFHLWQWKGSKIEYRTDTFMYPIKDFVKMTADELWIGTETNGQYIYNINSREYTKVLSKNAKKVFLYKDYMVLIDFSNAIIMYNHKTRSEYFKFRGHSDLITDISFHPTNNTFVTSSYDGSVKLWDFTKKELITTIIPFKNDDFIFISKDNYYLVSKGAINDFGFKYKEKYFYPDLFDIKYNRPDIVLKALNSPNSDLIAAYKQAYLKRLKKLNFTEDDLSIDFNLPEVTFKNLVDLKPKTNDPFLEIIVEARDDLHLLEKINIYLNGVAIYGVNGYGVADQATNLFEKKFKIPLASGKNKIEVNAQNEKGVESFKQTYFVTNTSKPKAADLYLVSIGVSDYEDDKYNLNYAAKDAKDMAKIFKSNKSFNNVFTKVFTNAEVTKENLQDVKSFLLNSKINDMVIVFVAGHGVLDEDFNYYFAAHDMDFLKPAAKGIPYELIENLVDNIKALRKLLFIDTCHSGEIEKDEVQKDTSIRTTEKSSDIIFRSAGAKLKDKDKLGLQSTNQLMKSLFTDLRKGTGATVISSSGGTEYAMEGDRWKNGLFTYCMLRGLDKRKADLNKDKKINISELQLYIQTEVNTISKGAQTPTSRFVNTQLDYRVW